MGFLADLTSDLADQISALDITAVTDPRNIKPPCALVNPPLVEIVNATGLIRATYPVQLIAGGPANEYAINQLYDMADAAITGLSATEARPVPVTIGSATYPGYELTVIITARP